MEFGAIHNNDDIIDKLISMVNDDRMPHSLLLSDQDGGSGFAIAMALVQYISCHDKTGRDSCGKCSNCHKISKMIHPDLHFVFPVNVTSKSGSEKKPVSDTFISIFRELALKNPYFTEEMLTQGLGLDNKVGTISVTEAKEILSTMNLRSYEGENKYMIIYLPERMTTEASNKLLKMIEEPFPGTYFIFVSHSPEKIISTIRSRCCELFLMPPPSSSSAGGNESMSENERLISTLISGVVDKDLVTVLMVSEELAALGRERQIDFCISAEVHIGGMWLQKIKLMEASKEQTALLERIPAEFFEKSYNYLENARSSIESNVNSKMIFCNLCNLFFVSI